MELSGYHWLPKGGYTLNSFDLCMSLFCGCFGFGTGDLDC